MEISSFLLCQDEVVCDLFLTFTTWPFVLLGNSSRYDFFFSNSEFFVNVSWVVGLCLEDGFLNALSCWLFGYEGGLFFSFYFLFSGGGKIAWEIFRGHQNLKMFLLMVLWQVVSISTDSIDLYIWMLMLSGGFG